MHIESCAVSHLKEIYNQILRLLRHDLCYDHAMIISCLHLPTWQFRIGSPCLLKGWERFAQRERERERGLQGERERERKERGDRGERERIVKEHGTNCSENTSGGRIILAGRG